MSTPTLAPPRRPTSPPVRPTTPRPRMRPAGPPAHHRSERRVWRWAIGVSIALHVLLLLVSPVFIRVGAPPGDPDAPLDPESLRGMRMVDPTAIPSQVAVVPATPQEDAVVEETPAAAPAERAPPTVRTPPTAAPAAPPAADAPARDHPLRPGVADPRLWVTPRDAPPEPEPTQEELHARYMEQLDARIRRLNDSIAGISERERRATDWTVRDKDGRRWGVSPDGIHLGGITLPPMSFPPGGGDPDKRREAEERERTRSEIDRQEADTERRRVQEERIRATRERRDQEREPD